MSILKSGFTAILIAFIVCGAGLATASPQAAKRVRASLNSGVVKLGDVGEIILEVNDAQNTRILEIPTVEGLKISNPGAPSVRMSQQFVGGRVSRSRTSTYIIRFSPLKAGEYSLGPIRLMVDGQEITTRAMPLTVVTDLDGARLGMLEFIDLPERVYDGEVFTIELRFGWDRKLNNINSADLRLPWWGNLSGLLEIPSEAKSLGGKPTRVNLNSEEQVDVLEVPQISIDGKPYRAFVLKRQFVATRTGELRIPKSFLAFSVVESGGIFNRQQKTRQRYFASAEPRSIEVRALPEEGRPLEYSNAVGRFHVRAQADRRDMDAGDSIKLTVEWLGKGNLEFFDRPDLGRLDGFEGFREYGVSRDSFLGDRRIVTYDIAPLSSDVTEIPGVPLHVFDTERGEYTTITTQPIRIRVRALEGESPLEVAGASGRAYDITDVEPHSGVVRTDSLFGVRRVLLAVLFAPLLAFGLRLLARRGGDPNSEVLIRRRKARRVLARALAKSDSASSQATALHLFLAARTNERDAAWLGRQVDAAKYSLSDDDAGELQRLLGRLDEATYAGNDAPLAKAELLALADRLVKGGL